jgi:hypothetical protein
LAGMQGIVCSTPTRASAVRTSRPIQLAVDGWHNLDDRPKDRAQARRELCLRGAAHVRLPSTAAWTWRLDQRRQATGRGVSAAANSMTASAWTR